MGKVKVEYLTKRFGKKIAVNNLSFEVKEGEHFSLLGPPGAGKTTTLRMIAGVEKPDEGNIYIDDVLVNDLPPKDRDIAMVFQSYALYPHKTVFENLAYPLRKLKLSESEIAKKVKETAEFLHIEPLLNKLPKHLSGGEKQRVAIGRAIIRSPKVYLLDEPLTNLDAKIRASMRTELKRLTKELKMTIIYATPDQIEAMSMADRIAIMNFGNLLQCDTPKNLYENPVNIFVAEFIGNYAMNFIDCTVIEKNGKVFLDANDFLYDISEYKELIREFIGSEVILGIRPEHISISKTKQSEDSIEAKVYLVEPTRPEMLLSVKIREKTLKVVTTEEFYFEAGEKAWLTFDKKKIHVFNKKSQNVII
ncbi:MAG: ABC transporter ATP-binding protein [Candidatus Methanomethylicaceae archaeon]